MAKSQGRTRPKQALSWICIAIGILAICGAVWMVTQTPFSATCHIGTAGLDDDVQLTHIG